MCGICGILELRGGVADAGLGTYPGQVVADLPYGIQKRIEVVRGPASRGAVTRTDRWACGS